MRSPRAAAEITCRPDRAAPDSATRAPRAAPGGLAALRLVALLAGFAASVGLRIQVGGPGVAQSAAAGWAFGLCLGLLAVAAGTRTELDLRSLRVGLGGAALLCVPVTFNQLVGHRALHGPAGFWQWALVVSVVAACEEAFLRGALYDAVRDVAGSVPAVAVGASAFALLHVPLYGWGVVPLDLVVGVVLGGLRASSGTWTAPAVAHVTADLAAWFLR